MLGVTNSPTGSPPSDFWGYVWSTIVSIADFIWRGIVAVGSFMIKLAVALGEICLKFVKALAQGNFSFIEAVVVAIVDAFMAFVNALWNFIKATILVALTWPLVEFWKAVESWSSGYLALNRDLSRKVETGSLSSEAAGRILFDFIFGNEALVLAIGVLTALSFVMLVVEPFVAPFVFVVAWIAPFIVGLIVNGLISIPGGSSPGVEEAMTGMPSYFDWLHDFFGSATMQGLMAVESIGMSLGKWILQSSLVLLNLAKNSVGVILAGIGLILTIISSKVAGSVREACSYVSVVLSGIGFMNAYFGFTGLEGVKLLDKVLLSVAGISLAASLINVVI